jgi:hypothetical protein
VAAGIDQPDGGPHTDWTVEHQQDGARGAPLKRRYIQGVLRHAQRAMTRRKERSVLGRWTHLCLGALGLLTLFVIILIRTRATAGALT